MTLENTQLESAAQPTEPTQPDQPADDKGSLLNKDKDKPAGAPESYEAFTFEGDAKLEGETLTELVEFAKGANLTQEQAQALAAREATRSQADAERVAAEAKKVTESWAGEARADKEFGGDKLEENLGVARKALDAFGSDKLREMLESSAMGNHPEVIRFFFKVGQAISEDKLVNGGKPPAPKRFFNHPTSNHAL